MLYVRSPGRKKTGGPESGHLKIPGQPEPDVMSGRALDTRDDQLLYEMFFKVLQKNAFSHKKIKIYARVPKFKK